MFVESKCHLKIIYSKNAIQLIKNFFVNYTKIFLNLLQEKFKTKICQLEIFLLISFLIYINLFRITKQASGIREF